MTDETAELKAKIEQLEKELDEKDNRLIRVQADFDNYRKRTRNEIGPSKNIVPSHLQRNY